MPPPDPGPWCCRVPIWGNPWLQGPGGSGLEAVFPQLAAFGFRHILQACHLGACLRATQPGVATAIQGLLERIPSSWRRAAWEQQASAPSEEQVVLEAVLPTLGWQLDGSPLPLSKLTVRQGTHLQLAEVRQLRRQRLAAFAALATAQPPTAQPSSSAEAVQPAPSAGDAGADAVLRMLARLWRFRWDNAHFEVYLRLVLNSLPVAARMGHSGRPCPCGERKPDRRHHFGSAMSPKLF